MALQTPSHPYRQHFATKSKELIEGMSIPANTPSPPIQSRLDSSLNHKPTLSSTSSEIIFQNTQNIPTTTAKYYPLESEALNSKTYNTSSSEQSIQQTYEQLSSHKNNTEQTGLRSSSFQSQSTTSDEFLVNSRSNSPPHNINSNKNRERRTKSVDLSHLYLLDRDKSTHFTMTNESLSDISHNMVKKYMGENSTLLPRLKTFEMYRKNVKKSNDPKVLFQYAQYMLQTALTIDSNNFEHDEQTQEKDIKQQFLKEAIYYLKKLSDKGYTDSQYLLADAYSSGALGKIENKEAFTLFQIAAKHGHVESAYRTAYCYEEGLGVSRDSRKAIDFLKYAASKNHPAAMYKLGLYSFYSKMGLADNVNVKKNGIQWLTRAVSSANELTNAAPYELAKIQQEGFLDIVIPDMKYAMELYIQAASLGHIKSASILGKAYEFGNQVVEADPNLSIHYYTQAALGNDTDSMLSLCAWYLVGNPPNLPKDDTEAAEWALKAANMNHLKAQFTVARFYEKGIGLEQDLQLAKQWYTKAAFQGDEKAKDKLKKIDQLENQSIEPKSKNIPLSIIANKSIDQLSDKYEIVNPSDTKKVKKIEKTKTKKKGKDKDCIIM